MKSMAELLPLRTKPKKRATERGELLKYFAEKTGKPIGYIAFKLTGIPTKDVYYIKSSCDQYRGEWAKAFYGQLKRR